MPAEHSSHDNKPKTTHPSLSTPQENSVLQYDPQFELDKLTPDNVIHLQRAIGNQAVIRLLAQRNQVKPDTKTNKTGLPDILKAGIENLSGLSMDDVHVHTNSSKPAEVSAAAYTQGTEIHLGQGQEQHLPHETWHVVQQKQGRVTPTFNVNGMPMNDDARLEQEADEMGHRALSGASLDAERLIEYQPSPPITTPVIQGVWVWILGNLKTRFNMTTNSDGTFQWGDTIYEATGEEHEGSSIVRQVSVGAASSSPGGTAPAPAAASSSSGGTAPAPAAASSSSGGTAPAPAAASSSSGGKRGASAAPEIPADVLKKINDIGEEGYEPLDKPASGLTLACWNWTLTAFQGTGINPQPFFEYLHSPDDLENFNKFRLLLNADQRERLHVIAAQMRDQKLTWHQRVDSPTKKLTKTEKANAKTHIQTAAAILIQSHGFEIVGEHETNKVIVLQYKVADGVSWEHWWIEIDGVVLETFPEIKTVSVTPNRQHEKEVDKGTYVNLRFPIRQLKAAHIDFITTEIRKLIGKKRR